MPGLKQPLLLFILIGEEVCETDLDLWVSSSFALDPDSMTASSSAHCWQIVLEMCCSRDSDLRKMFSPSGLFCALYLKVLKFLEPEAAMVESS